ncbi:MAG: RES family NAD+ phosphorylase, partial [Vulcanimicrobiaceae bacterium]
MTASATIAYDKRVHRIAFPLRSPLTETLVDPTDRVDLEALLASTSVIESHRSGDRRIVAPDADYVGDLREYVLAPFAYRSASRFSDGSFGVLYAGETRETALREVLSRLTRVYLDGRAPAQETRKQHLTLRIVAADRVDIRSKYAPAVDTAIYHPTDYTAARSFGSSIRERYPGLTYDSVRHRGGVCVGAFV